jgi:predicted outer membrane repeat protein
VIHCVDAANSSPVAPYSNWSTAATNIQDAIDAAEVGAIVLVTNGLYSSGGQAMAGDLVNRIAITKAMTVVSVNGPAVTVIQGAWDAATNGAAAVRCAWLTNGALLNGFTLQNGATRSSGGPELQNGGGIFGVSTQALALNCFIYTNAAFSEGGGSYGAVLDRCQIMGNSAVNGGGAAFGIVKNSFVAQNSASANGGGIYGSELKSCTVVANSGRTGAGVFAIYIAPQNSIIYGNGFGSVLPNDFYGVSVFPINCCIYRYPSNSPNYVVNGNLDADPQFTAEFHLATTSPCRGAGNAHYTSATDLDGEPWLNPPSIGCDEVIEENIKGPLLVDVTPQFSEVVAGQMMFLSASLKGRASRLEWDYGDGSALTNFTAKRTFHAWTNAGNYTARFTAYNFDHPEGVSTNIPIHVVPFFPPTFSQFNLDGTNFSLGFWPQQSLFYDLQRATNLTPPIVWQTFDVVYDATNFVEITDTRATNSSGFYRVRIR